MPDLPRALLLDLDDTILDFSRMAPVLWRELCAEYGPRLGAAEAGALFDALQERARRFWSDPRTERPGRLDLPGSRRRIVRAALDDLGLESGDGCGEALADEFTRRREERIVPLPGALESLAAFAARGVRLALVTNGASAPQRRKIERFDLGRRFDAILVEGEVGAGKPDAAIFREALARLDVSASEAWMVGDNLEADVGGSQGVGIVGIWVSPRGAEVPPGSAVRPDRIVRSLADLAAGASA